MKGLEYPGSSVNSAHFALPDTRHPLSHRASATLIAQRPDPLISARARRVAPRPSQPRNSLTSSGLGAGRIAPPSSLPVVNYQIWFIPSRRPRRARARCVRSATVCRPTSGLPGMAAGALTSPVTRGARTTRSLSSGSSLIRSSRIIKMSDDVKRWVYVLVIEHRHRRTRASGRARRHRGAHGRSVVARIEGYSIRPITSERFGKIYLIDGANIGFGTIERFKAWVRAQRKEPA
jgi:hypothetical protein